MKRVLLIPAIVLSGVVVGLLSLHPVQAHNPDPNDPLQAAMPVLKVSDIAKSSKYYQDVLGFHEEFRAGEPVLTYAGVGRGMVNYHLSTGANAIEKGTIYHMVKNVDKLHDEFKAKGANIIEPLGDRSYQMRDFSLKTPDGHVLVFGEPIQKKEAPATSAGRE